MRTMVTPEDESLLVQMYVNKNSIKTISKKTGYSEKDIKEIISRNRDTIGKSLQRKYTVRDKMGMVASLYERGYTPENIHRILDITYDMIWVILGEKGLFDNVMCSNKNITIQKLNAFADSVSIGEKYKIYAPRDNVFDNLYGNYYRVITVKVIKKYPHFVITDLGDFSYLDLYNGRRL